MVCNWNLDASAQTNLKSLHVIIQLGVLRSIAKSGIGRGIGQESESKIVRTARTTRMTTQNNKGRKRIIERRSTGPMAPR